MIRPIKNIFNCFLAYRNPGLLLLVLFGFTGVTFGQVKLVKTKISDRITMKVPASFIQMSEDDMWQRVSSYRKSAALYTDLSRVIELGVNHAFSTWQAADLDILQSVYKASILELFDEVNFSIEEIRTIKGREYVVFEFVSKMEGEKTLAGNYRNVSRYYYIQYTIYDLGTLVVDFSCPKHLMEDWQSSTHDIMKSIKIK